MVSEALQNCQFVGCSVAAERRCARCMRQICDRHTIADYHHLPGGQRPYCLECDAERQQLYQAMRRQGLRAIVWSGIGAIIGAFLGHTAGTLLSPDSFTHTVTTDVGFLMGLGGALLGALVPIRQGNRPDRGD
ncbi:MAG TPA: hypothetical protein VMW65_04520 [Chloroflexota bacterium]|nr:hypothetical protein [Chloroflexota bacterium]